MIFVDGILAILLGPIQLFISKDFEVIKALILGIQMSAFANYIYLLWRDR